MKKISALSLIGLISFCNATIFAQPFTTVWNYALGGNGNDQGYAIAATSGNGTVSVGQTNSNNNGDVGATHGGYDAWIVKQDSNGAIVWQKPLGGSGDDYFTDVAVDANGLIYAIGYTRSGDGDVHGNHSAGGYDMWVIKFNANGDTLQTKCFGGDGDDISTSIAIANNGDLFVCGRGYSSDGDLSGCVINSMWIMRLNTSLDKIWSNCFHGGGYAPYLNTLNDVQATADGGCITTGGSLAIPAGHGADDAWVAKLDSLGNIQWERALGGSFSDAGMHVIATSDGGYLVSIRCGSDDFDGEGHHGDVGSVGADDVLLVKLDASGNTFWKRCWGGSGTETVGEIIETQDHNFLSINGTTSIDGDVLGTGGDSYYNGWIFKVDPLDTLIWQQVIFSHGEEVIFPNSATVATDNSYVINGFAYGNSIPGYHDQYDFYTLKINEPSTPPLPIAPWATTFGGSDIDEAYDAGPTSDDGVIVAGTSRSTDGDVTGQHGLTDRWIVKADAYGNLQKENCYGDGGHDYVNSVQQTADDGYVFTGGPLIWNITKIDTGFNINWDDTYGGDGYAPYSIQQINDGGYIVAGQKHWAVPPDTIITDHSKTELLIMKLDVSGNFLWEKFYGGSLGESANCIDQTSDNGFVAAGYTSSSNGNVTGSHGGKDGWVIKTNANGILQWQKTLGGLKTDQANWVRQTSDGGYIVAGETNSIDGDAAGNHGNYDFLVVKLNSGGGIVWKKVLGGSASDKAHSICQTEDGGYIVAGETASNNGNVSGNHGQSDYWLVKLDGSGNLLWQKCLGGTGADIARSISAASDGRVIVGGQTGSTDGDVVGNHGATDFWVMKLIDGNQLFFQDADGDGYGNPLVSVSGFFPPTGYVFNDLDCNDENPDVHPGILLDPCNGLDDDCDGVIDENGSYVRYYPDSDGDGYGAPGNFIYDCSLPAGYVTNNTDCNDANPSAHPGACEIYANGVDEDCDGAADDCNTPSSGFKTTNITMNSAKVKWDTIACAIGYTVQYRITGSGTWLTAKVSMNTGVKKLKNLQVNTTYEWQVRTKCNSGPTVYSDYSATHTFTTDALRFGTESPDFTDIKLTPNPTDHLVKISCDECQGINQVNFYNVLGQKILSRSVMPSDDAFTETINVSGLPAGLYVVELKGAAGSGTVKMLKE